MKDINSGLDLEALRQTALILAKRFFKATGLRNDPQDVAQEVLARFWLALKGGAEIRSQEAWVTRVTKNLCVSIFRQERNKAPSPLSVSICSEESASSIIENEETLKKVHKALTDMPEATLRLLRPKSSGMSLDEIACVTGRPKGSVKTSMSIARKQIISILKSER